MMDPTATRNSSSILSCQVLAAIMRTGMELRNAGPGRPPGGNALKTGTELARVPFAARGPIKLPRGALDDELSTQAQDVEPFLAASRSSDQASRRSCGAIAELQLHTLSSAIPFLMAGRWTASALIESTSPVSFVLWSIAPSRRH